MLENSQFKNKFIQENSPGDALNRMVQGKDFLQSEEWRKFQESVARRTFHVESEGFWANVIEHELPIVGKYFYLPHGPACHLERSVAESKDLIKLDSSTALGMTELINLAKKENTGWIRIEPANNGILELLRHSMSKYKIQKAPHDMQPREILVMDITKPEERLLAEMKAKTRYNIKVAQKRNVKINVIPAQAGIQNNSLDSGSEAGMTNKYIEEFIKLVKITAERDKIKTHPESYYRKMFETVPGGILKFYVAEYEGKVIAANIVIFYGDTATYLHGASDNEYRNVMAPYLLQWQAILDAKKAGYQKYDLGGIKSCITQHEICNNRWAGITRFKLGFAPNVEPTRFPGSYDIILNPKKYYLYRFLQKIKKIL